MLYYLVVLQELIKFAAELKERPSWDEYGMALAVIASTRSLCSVNKVGSAILSANHRVISTGYNGQPAGWKKDPFSCCPKFNESGLPTGRRCSAIHSEINAILMAKETGKSLAGSTIYVTLMPCFDCFKAISQAGIKRIAFLHIYRRAESLAENKYDDLEAREVIFHAQENGIELVDMNNNQELLEKLADWPLAEKWR